MCASYSAPPDHVMQNVRLDGHVFQTMQGTFSICLDACAMDCRCLSFNLDRNTGQCELSSEDNETTALNSSRDHDHYKLIISDAEVSTNVSIV